MKHWIFDLDGTLVDSFASYFETLEEIFRRHGETFSPGLRQAALTEPLEDFFRSHLGAAAVPRAYALLRALSNEGAMRIRPFEGVTPIIEGLVGRGARVAIWTNRDLESASLILKHSGLDRLTELCVSGTCVNRRKPHPEGLLRIIGHFGCAPAEATMVGDHEHDVTAAKTVGARAVRASWHAYWPERACETADHQFKDVGGFASWVGTAG